MPQTRKETAADVREVAATHKLALSEEQVDAAVEAHLKGKAYYDAIMVAMKRPSVRDQKANEMEEAA